MGSEFIFLFILRVGCVVDAVNVLRSPARQHPGSIPAASIATACGGLDLQPGDSELLAGVDLFADCPDARARTLVAGAAARFCTLPVCTMHAPDAPRLYASGHWAGHGYKLLHLFTAMAVADRSGMNFGGLVVNRTRMGTHGVDFKKVLTEFLGKQYSDIFIEAENVPEVWDAVNTSGAASAPAAAGGTARNVLLEGHWSVNGITNDTELLALIRSTSSPPSFATRPDTPLVAMHVRRGDLQPWNPVIERTPDSYFYGVADLIRRDFPQADIHVFSCVEDRGFWNASSFKGYEERGMRVHLDEVGAGTALSVMSRADVLVMSPSTFSLAAGCLNPNCVVFSQQAGAAEMWWSPGRSRWGEPGSNFSTDLQRCLRSPGSKHGATGEE